MTPNILEGGLERAQLEEDLRRMRCVGLLEQLWGLKQEEIVRELVAMECPNIFDGTIRDRPQLWTADLWRDVYNFPEGGAGLANRMDGYIKGQFIHQVDPKVGYQVRDCRNDRQCRVLEFLVLIIHPDKPTRVTITIRNTIFRALDGGKEVDWGVVFRDLAQRLAKGVRKPKPTPICSFLFHLYDNQGLLTEEEDLDYRTAKELAGYEITPDPDSRPESEDEGRPSSLARPGGASADSKPEEEEHLPNATGIATCPVKRRGESASTGSSSTGASSARATAIRATLAGTSSTRAAPTGAIRGAGGGGLGMGSETFCGRCQEYALSEGTIQCNGGQAHGNQKGV